MKVTGPTGPSRAQASRPAQAAQGFTLGGAGQATAPAQTAATSAASGVAGVSALMALQGVEDATEKRRRAIRRGGGLLDRLDELKLAMLAGQDGSMSLQRLSRELGAARDSVEDAGLDALLAQIDLRASVELAKAERR